MLRRPMDAPSKSSMDETIIFNTEALADAAVMGIHQSFGETNSYRGRYLAYFGVNTDCEIFNNSGMNNVETDKEGSLVTYSAKPDNTYMNTDNNSPYSWAILVLVKSLFSRIALMPLLARSMASYNFAHALLSVFIYVLSGLAE